MQKKYIVIAISIVSTLLYGCVGGKHFAASVKNKILVYSSESVPNNPDKYEFNSFYIDFLNDSIIPVRQPFNHFEEHSEPHDSVYLNDSVMRVKYRKVKDYPEANLPFKFTKVKKSIFIGYTKMGAKVNERYYTLSKKDSVETLTYDFLCDNTPGNYEVSKYLGTATLNLLYGKKIKCWVFEEFFNRGFPSVDLRRLVYLEKKSLLPVQIITTYLRPNKDGSYNKTYEVTYKEKIVSIADRPYFPSERGWLYPKCNDE
jgi:hypothetical protein